MKKIIALIFVITIVISACSKERKLNRKLDGKWSLETMNGIALASGESSFIEFSKDKKDNGTYTISYTDSTFTLSESGNYTLDKDDKIMFSPSAGSLTANFTNTVSDYDKESLTMVDPDGWVYVYKKK